MVDNIRQESDLRSRLKCSMCREKKIRCTPRDRPWEETHQKCDNCQKHDDYPCGPNLLASQETVLSPARGHDSTRDPGDEPRTPASQRTGTQHGELYVGEGDEEQPSMVVEKSTNPRKRKLASTEESEEPEELVDKANRLLGELNASGGICNIASLRTRIHCLDQKNQKMLNSPHDRQTRTFRKDLHELFMSICRLGAQLHKRGENSDAERIFLKLNGALQKYPELGDESKNAALWIIADFFRDIGDKDEHESVLTKIAETHTSLHPRDPHKPLANSLIETSKRTDDYILKLWERLYMVRGETSLALPPIQRSAQLRCKDFRSILQYFPNSIALSPPALFNQEALHIAAAHGYEETLRALLEARAPVDAVDVHNHTALFLAALKGHDGCCAQLIKYDADPNRRNRHGTTILEAAAGAGHINVVKQLVRAEAEVNPDLVCCSSSPLQAAIENLESPDSIAMYLIGKKGDVSIRRSDGKNAIDLADNKCIVLASIMRQIQMQGPQDLFDQPQISFYRIDLQSGPAPV